MQLTARRPKIMVSADGTGIREVLGGWCGLGDGWQPGAAMLAAARIMGVAAQTGRGCCTRVSAAGLLHCCALTAR